MKLSKQQQGEQLNYLYQLLRDSLKMRSTIRGWCITVWSGVFIVTFVPLYKILTQYPIAENPRRISIVVLFLFTPALLFWVLEAIEGAKTNIYKDLLTQMEDCMVNGKKRDKYYEDFFVMTKYQNISFWSKLLYFLKGLFLNETTVSFYLIFALISFIFTILIGAISMSGVQLGMLPKP